RRRESRRHHRIVSRAGQGGCAHVGPSEEQSLVGRVDGGRVHANDHLVGFWLRGDDADQRQLEDAVLVYRRTKLKSSSSACVCHGVFRGVGWRDDQPPWAAEICAACSTACSPMRRARNSIETTPNTG